MEEKGRTRPRQRHVTISPVPITPVGNHNSIITKTITPWGDSYSDSSYVSEHSVVKRTGNGDSFPLSSTTFFPTDDHFRKIEEHMKAIQKEMHNMIYEHVPNAFKQQVVMETPTITGINGSKMLEFKFDVKNYKPDEISIKTFENDLTVYAKHESNSNDSKEFREYSRTITLPKEVDPATLSSMLLADGVLVIQAPIAKSIKNEVHILPIEHMKKDDEKKGNESTEVKQEISLDVDLSDLENQIVQ